MRLIVAIRLSGFITGADLKYGRAVRPRPWHGPHLPDCSVRWSASSSPGWQLADSGIFPGAGLGLTPLPTGCFPACCTQLQTGPGPRTCGSGLHDLRGTMCRIGPKHLGQFAQRGEIVSNTTVAD